MTVLDHFHQRIARVQADSREKPVLVCCLGDSVTRGWGHETIQFHDAYPARLAAWLHDRHPGCAFDVLNAGQSGDTARGALTRIERDVLRHEPDLTTVCFGLNDVLAGGDAGAPAFREAMEKVVALLEDAGSDVIVLTPNMMATRTSPLIPHRFQGLGERIVAARLEGVLERYVGEACAVAAAHAVPVADAYALWCQAAAGGVDTTLLLANGLNHPFGHAHRFFLDALAAVLSARPGLVAPVDGAPVL